MQCQGTIDVIFDDENFGRLCCVLIFQLDRNYKVWCLFYALTFTFFLCLFLIDLELVLKTYDMSGQTDLWTLELVLVASFEHIHQVKAEITLIVSN